MNARRSARVRPIRARLGPAIFATVVCTGCASPPVQTELLIENATVIDPAARRMSANHSIFVADGRIVAIEPTERATGFVATDTIDGTDRFVVPGLLDMHVHLFRDDEVAEQTLDLLLAHGVTGFREMSSDCVGPRRDDSVCVDDLRTLDREVTAGTRLRPRPLAVASAAVNGVSQRDGLPEEAPDFLAPGTEEDGRELARWIAARDVDVVKVYNSVPREAYFGLLDEANRLGLEVSGHLPLGVSVVEASDAGHGTIEHARDLPVACGSYGTAYRQRMARVVDGEPGVEAPSAEERIRAVLDAFDEEACRDVLDVLAANGTYLVPTHGTREMDARAGEAAYRADDRLRWVEPRVRSGWEADLDRTARATPELVELFRAFYALGLRTTGMAHTAGVAIMAGTDANDTMMFPGSALHDELERFEEAGIAPMDVLRTATTTPSTYLGREADLGGVSVGRLADLLLLTDDPLDDIANTRAIEAVVLGGRLLDRTALDALLEGAARRAASSEQSPTESG